MDFTTLTPSQKCKYLVLAKLFDWRAAELPPFTSGADIDAHYQNEYENDGGQFQDARNETREGTEAPEITDTPPSRHYEIDANVGKLPDGTFVGWWYWHGGGKTGEPEAYDWVGNAFAVTHISEVITTTKYTFTKAA